ncbi:replication endonuclease [Modicisalibacter sp. MOD 31.J]|uniref:replication endonuclease n=1 Tax=Modicisalibacter sp. MOD 31.J TaxID=2831897 RepID=UPI001CCC1744|nr:replication endonuclease [Modicisalibacter sp. MOD 31.J]MBZ9576757.1 replication endonuclease [Modicisalibacter sp. MOD 31.J]
MTALEQSRAYGTADCRRWRQAEFFDRLPSLAEDLAAGFVHVAKRYGNAAGNRWLRRQASDLIEPGHVYRRFASIATDLERGAKALRRREPTTIEGIQSANRWLTEVEQRLVLGGLNATHDDDALVAYAAAQARAIEDERGRRLAGINEHNRRLRLGLLPPPAALPRPRGKSVSAQHRHMAELIARARNPLTPPPAGIPLMAVFRWHRAPVMSQSVADALTVRRARERARAHGIQPPDPKAPLGEQIGRLCDAKWWRRKLRVTAGRRIEQIQREAHRVHAQAGIYCSDMTIYRRRSQKVRNRALLETIEAINQDGQVYTLAELAELGLANPDHRRAELMLRIRDTEAEARHLGHVGMFYTITTPSRFHPVIANRTGKGKRYRCRRNPKYDGSTPREAQQHLQKLWAQARAKLAREGLAIYGIRVAEPHHDGTPHWHLLVWMKPGDEARVTETLREYAEAESPEELFDRNGKTNARFDAKAIDYSRGTATGYVAKYISKNINGEQFMDADHYGRSMNDSAPRIEAWAATWGIRQFQFVGLPSVTVWREVRRLTEKQEDQLKRWEEATRPAPRVAETLREIRQAANAGEWDRFVRLMGGPNRPRKERPLKPWRVERLDTGRAGVSHATGEESQDITARGRYGEPVTATWGLVVTDPRGRQAEYLTRLYRWEIRPRQSLAAGTSGAGEAGAPWTCVNNCTGVDITPRTPPPEVLAEQVRRYDEWRASDEVRAQLDDVTFEERMLQAQSRQRLQHDAKAREELARRGIHIPAPEPEPAEFWPEGI